MAPRLCPRGLAVNTDAVHVGKQLRVRRSGSGAYGPYTWDYIALNVCLGAVISDHFLAVSYVLQKALVIFGAVCLVAVVGDANKAFGASVPMQLHAAANTVADEPGHELLLQQVILAAWIWVALLMILPPYRGC